MQVALYTAVVVALIVRARLGFGFSLVLVPLTTLLIGFDAAVLFAVSLEVVSSLIMAIVLRKSLRLLDAAVMKLFSLGGLGVGLLLREVVSRVLVVFVSMLVIIGMCLWLLLRGHRPPSMQRNATGIAGTGFVSGFLNSWTSLSGPPIVMYYLSTEDDEQTIKGALTGYFSVLYVITFGLLVATGGYRTFPYWTIAGVNAIIIAAGYPVIRRLVTLIRLRFDRMALMLVILSALLVVYQEGIR